MFSCLVPGLNSASFTEVELVDRVPVWFRSVLNACGTWLTFFRRQLPLKECSCSTLVVLFGACVALIVSFACSLLSKKKKGAFGWSEPAGDAPESDAEAVLWNRLYDALFLENNEMINSLPDAKYAEDLQVQEVLCASLYNSSSSAIQARPTLMSELMNVEKDIAESSQVFCEICLEDRESWQMFKNENCSHSFCCDCISKHIVARIENHNKYVACPGVNCCALLYSDACRLLIPDDILILWDESLCKSLIPESEKLYCPFRDCSAMLVNDSGEVIREIDCPECGRSFCALCRVPWHAEFTCKEFQKLNVKKKGKEDLMVDMLAKKKQWRKCPQCRIYIEKTQGCLHITCRCGYEFCYRCGSKYNVKHGDCQPR
ncbi:hypothetical protein RJ639_047631 [Escallonia herrerae]|uniref:RBR-type E3 ubiquitin transferase n=1 Tax=Escallonia herrerae TaxID=1293975 RepID=A0AA88W7N2_9ASTE|nr:hypothetical protein RJ639_047631 [Escallonia herrerae]